MKPVFNLLNKFSYQKGLVLMYHRIAEPVSDVWELSVSAQNFEQHLQALRKYWTVISLQEMAKQVKEKKIKKNTVAITFDDGYTDNFLAARPLLEEYQLPAAFFVTTSNIGHQIEFWWDELENIFLFTQQLPQHFSLTINNNNLNFNLENETVLTQSAEQIHKNWRATLEDPPNLRCRLFFKAWQALQPLPYTQQQTALKQIKEWAQIKYAVRTEYTCMSIEQLKTLSSGIFDIAVHTSTHPSLAHHDKLFQQKEITENKNFLEELSGKTINILSYPYGNYNNITLDVVKNTGFNAAFTTEEKPVSKNSDQFKLGRFQVKNWGRNIFEKQMQKWIKQN